MSELDVPAQENAEVGSLGGGANVLPASRDERVSDSEVVRV